jgi:hypothetical protein
MKVPRKKNGYANGGAVGDKKEGQPAATASTVNPAPKPAAPAFSWEDYNAKLNAWQNPSAQFVPKEIAQYQSQWIVPTIKNYQTTLNQALQAKYSLPAGQAPAQNQFLTAQEAAQALGGQQQYADYLQFVGGYQQYRSKTAGSYSAPAATAGTLDPAGEAYGYRHYGLFSVTPEQAQQNIQTTQQVRPQVLQSTAVPGMKNGGKVGMADGGFSLTPEQQAYLDTLGTEEAKNQFLSTIMPKAVNKGSAAASGVFSKLNGQLPFAMIGATAGNVLDKSVQLDPNNQKQGFFNQNQEEVKGAGVGALKGAGTGLSIGLNPVLMAATGGLSAPIGAAAGTLIGGGVGWSKGKKVGQAQDDVRNLSAQRMAMDKSFTGMKDGGKVVGPGTGRSDDVPAEIKQGSFIVPAKNAKLAEKIRKQFLGDTGKEVANLDQAGAGTVSVLLSNGEHKFTPEEADVLVNTHGINLDALAPDSDKKMGYGYQNGGYVSAHKAKKILKDGTVRGNKLTEDQMKYFGWIAGGRKKGYKDGGEVDGDETPAEKAARLKKEAEEQKKAKEAQDKKDKEDAYFLNKAKNLQSLNDAKKERQETTRQEFLDAKKNLEFINSDIDRRQSQRKAKGLPPLPADRLLSELNKAQSRFDQASKDYDAAMKDENYQQAADGTVTYNPAGGGAPAPKAAEPAKPEPMVTAAELAKKNQTKQTQQMVFDPQKGQYVAAPAGTAPDATAQPSAAARVFSGGGGGGQSSLEKPVTADLKAIQDRFIAAHGGIDTGEAPGTAEPTKTAKEAPLIDSMKKQWQELMDAGKVGEAQALEEQIKQMGYRYEYNPQTKTSDWVSAAGKSIGAQGVFQEMGDLTTAAETPAEAQAAANLPGANIKKVYDALGGAGGLLGLGQAAIGLVQSARNKRPVDTVDPLLVQRRDQAIAESMYGFEPQELSAAKQDIATQRSNVFGMIKETAGGDVGAASANARLAALDANKAALNLSAADVRMREQKKSRADALTQNVAESKRRIFQDSMTAFQQNQAASSELIGAGISNIFGAIQAQNNKQAADERADKYGNVFMGLPTTP